MKQQEIYGKEYGYYENELKKAGIRCPGEWIRRDPGKTG